MRPLFLALLSSLLLVVPGFAKVWLVGGPNADFAQVQPAIDVAQDGDVILVRDGTYESFRLDKGVIVRGSPGFSIPNDAKPVEIMNITAGRKGGVAGMTFLAGWLSPARLNVHHCAGEVVLSEITVRATAAPDSWPPFGPFPDGNAVSILHCDNVAITELIVAQGTQPTTGSNAQPALSIDGSRVRIDGSSVLGSNGSDGIYNEISGVAGYGCDAIAATNGSLLIVATTRALGGDGGDSEYVGDGIPEPHGGDGGDGVLAVDAGSVILGSEGNTLAGGDGGEAGYAGPFGGYLGHGGAGGNGYRGGAALISRVTMSGGKGGIGSPDGSDGVPYSGTVTLDPRLPYLVTSADVNPGGTFAIDVAGSEPGIALLFLAGLGGFLPVYSAVGPPLCAVPGAWFFVFGIGHNDGVNPISLQVPLIDDPILFGLSINAQAAILTDAGGQILLSNSSTRVGRE
jgi:hypothetical protein